jgi:hypothetical protein
MNIVMRVEKQKKWTLFLNKRSIYSFCLVLLSIHSRLYSNFLSGISRLFSTQYYKREHIIASARQNMPPELQACKSLTDAELLLRKEEKQCLTAIKDAFNVPDQAWNECNAEIKAQMQYCRDIYFKTSRPEIDHSLSTLDPELFKRITQAMKIYGINPDSINIIYDQQWHAEHPGCPAYSRNPAIERTISKARELEVCKAAQISFIPSSLITSSSGNHTEFTPFHEAFHLIDGHGLQEDVVRKTLIKSSAAQYQKERLHPSLREWGRSQEKIAEIMPLIQLKNPRHVQVLYKKYLNSCMCDVYNGNKIIWNKTIDADAIHPDVCAVMLPWILKIQELMPKEPQ